MRKFKMATILLYGKNKFSYIQILLREWYWELHIGMLNAGKHCRDVGSHLKVYSFNI